MPENVNWSAVWQSIANTWLPLLGVVAVVAIAAIVIHVIRKRKK
ncbi:LPXTG cell wall anchor domain-containing protein [Enterocloster clostridioformis]|nr:LPXTG cell wall anchor domain-containing protein [Enterocloster clostridioformis]NDO31013.1 LPXTG cell wall anchor domain-containing protein [Enterocloster clostridioformis]QQR03748.1 LPXTG cell wall anchor domain-containing protein [Enterocloster clostridioformis]